LGKKIASVREYFDATQASSEFSFAPRERYKGVKLEDVLTRSDRSLSSRLPTVYASCIFIGAVELNRSVRCDTRAALIS
jgi:hypothetical protein